MDSNSPFKDLLFPSGPNLAQKPWYLVGTVLNLVHNTAGVHILVVEWTLLYIHTRIHTLLYLPSALSRPFIRIGIEVEVLKAFQTRSLRIFSKYFQSCE